MIKKLLLLLTFTAVSLFAINFQTASKEDLMSIKGIGEKRAAAIMKYRKTHKIKSAADLKNVPGIGNEIAENARKGIKNADKKVKKAKSTSTRTKSLKDKAVKKKRSVKEKTTTKVKKTAGDKTKRAQKRAKDKAKSKAKKSLKSVKEKAKKH